MAPTINLDYLETNFGRDRRFIAEIVDIFLEEVPVRFKRLGELIFAGDWAAAALEGHCIKASVKMVGLDTVYRMVLAVEQAVADESFRAGIPEKYAQCRPLVEQALKEMAAYRNRL